MSVSSSSSFNREGLDPAEHAKHEDLLKVYNQLWHNIDRHYFGAGS